MTKNDLYTESTQIQIYRELSRDDFWSQFPEAHTDLKNFIIQCLELKDMEQLNDAWEFYENDIFLEQLNHAYVFTLDEFMNEYDIPFEDSDNGFETFDEVLERLDDSIIYFDEDIIIIDLM